MPTRTPEYLRNLVGELRALPKETEWLEFKANDPSPEHIGQYLSALSNMAAWRDRSFGYLVWGVDDATHAVIGTTFNPWREKKGNEDLIPWLTRGLTPPLVFEFFEVEVEGKRVVVLEIPAATRHLTQFSGEEYGRVETATKPLRGLLPLRDAIQEKLRSTAFETLRAAEHQAVEDVLKLLDYPAYFHVLGKPLPATPSGIVARLSEDKMIAPDDAGRWDITNLGALLFARDLRDFPRLGRKALRIIKYEGKNRMAARPEEIHVQGYASGFEGFIRYVNALVPNNEVLGQALRVDVPMYPELAIRELVANALIHQDLTITGAGPTVEIFANRIEITNPGLPLVSPRRFLGTAPRSRNEALAGFMHRIGVCEERGSGIYKVVEAVERHQLPAPLFQKTEHATRVVLFGHKEFGQMSKEEKIEASYWHACLRYADHETLTNSSLRQRFGLEDASIATVSRIIRDTVKAHLIKPFDPEQKSRGLASYVPAWVD